MIDALARGLSLLDRVRFECLVGDAEALAGSIRHDRDVVMQFDRLVDGTEH